VRLVFIAVAVLLAGCRCPADRPPPSAVEEPRADVADPADDRPSSLLSPPREPGPPRAESDEQVERARREAEALVVSLRAGGVAPREVTSTADIRGFRLFRRRYFRQARVWFEAAVRSDPTFEPALYNAARAAAAAGDLRAAREHLRRLAALKTPLARGKLRQARDDSDLAELYR
jgi:tetratricopeptide (TPR) repeat protein